MFLDKYNPMFRLSEILLTNISQSLNNVPCEEYEKSFGVTNPSSRSLSLDVLQFLSIQSIPSLRKKEKRVFLSRNVEFLSFSKARFP